MKVVVSACLLGRNCKYNGGNNYSPQVEAFVQGKEMIEVCPEVLAGLGTPRIPIELRAGKVIRKDGLEVDAPLRQAVEVILRQLEGQEIQCAILKSRSPTCGVKQVYDGSFTGTLVDGMGVLAQALQAAGYTVIDSEEV